jgi:probable HAF family extracellular repeat protein
MKTFWRRNFLIGLVGALVIAVGLSIFTPSRATTLFYYSVTDLGTLGGTESFAYGINDGGQVVGAARTSSGSSQAFLWNNGQMRNLGTLGGNSSRANGINNKGQVVGWANTSSGSSHAVLWNSSGIQDLGTLGGFASMAYGINNRGQVVGQSDTGRGSRAFWWHNGAMKDLAPLNRRIITSAHGINNRGQAVGWFSNGMDDSQAILLQNAKMTYLGHIGGITQARAINYRGQIVGAGVQEGGGGYHAILWNNGVAKNLDPLNSHRYSIAYGINFKGQVVGRAITTSGVQRAFLWQNDTMIDLNSLIPRNSGWELFWAADINNRGQIVGHGKHNNQTRAFLLTPTWFTR